MWHCLYPDKPVEQVPIGHITNGIHLLGWMKGPVRRFWRRKLMAAPPSRSRHNLPAPPFRLGHPHQLAGILEEDDGSGFHFRRGIMGLALQVAPRIDRIRTAPVGSFSGSV